MDVPAKYIVLLHDPESRSYKQGSVMYKGLFECFGNRDMIDENNCFDSTNEAEQYINELLTARMMTGGRLRDDITRDNFTIKEVYQFQRMKNVYMRNREDALL